jgi:hypothetical protein
MTHTTHPCLYIGGEGYKPTCTHTAMEGANYCVHHYPMIYQAGTARARRKKDLRVAAAVWDLESEFNAAVEELVMEGYNFDEPRWEVVEA